MAAAHQLTHGSPTVTCVSSRAIGAQCLPWRWGAGFAAKAHRTCAHIMAWLGGLTQPFRKHASYEVAAGTSCTDVAALSVFGRIWACSVFPNACECGHESGVRVASWGLAGRPWQVVGQTTVGSAASRAPGSVRPASEPRACLCNYRALPDSTCRLSWRSDGRWRWPPCPSPRHHVCTRAPMPQREWRKAPNLGANSYLLL